MENSSLNKAHQILRRAELKLRNRNFEETITLYTQAMEFFQDALTCTANPRSIESIKLQHDHLARQKKLLALKLEQVEKFQKLNQNKMEGFGSNSQAMTRYIEQEFTDKFDKFENLLDLLDESGILEDEDVKPVVKSDECNCSVDGIGSSFSSATSCKSNKRTILTDLKSINTEMRLLCGRLFAQIDSQNQEISQLKAKLQQNEAGFKETNIGGLKVCDSSGDASPYVFSPYELCPDVLED